MGRALRWAIRLLLGAVALVALLWLSGAAYQEYWIRRAGRAVTLAANDIAAEAYPQNVRFSKYLDREALSVALASGFSIVECDSIVFSFRDYEVKIRVANGDQYNFDAYHREDGWQIDCCGHWAASGLH